MQLKIRAQALALAAMTVAGLAAADTTKKPADAARSRRSKRPARTRRP
jgi:hypothetical protein